jgi:hypothetical protein
MVNVIEEKVEESFIFAYAAQGGFCLSKGGRKEEHFLLHS